MGVEDVEPLWGSLGEEGNDESVISSMSEWDDADLGDFFLVKACLKELRSWGGRDSKDVQRHVETHQDTQGETEMKSYGVLGQAIL